MTIYLANPLWGGISGGAKGKEAAVHNKVEQEAATSVSSASYKGQSHQ